MNKYLSLLLMILISGCASPAQSFPTAAPGTARTATSAPVAVPTAGTKPTSQPQATSAAIAVLNIKQEKQPDGSIHTTANVSTQDNLGLGQVDLASPDAMKLGDSTSIRLRLSPAQQLASLTPVAAPGKTPDTPNYVYQLKGNVQLYPIMYAQLRAVSFDIDQKQPVSRIVESGKNVEWIWAVKPTAPGRQELVIELSIPIIINGLTSEISTHVLQDLTLAIQVNAPPPPTAVPTPALSERIFDSMVNNAGAITVAVIGVIGTILGGIIALRKKSS